MVEIEDIPQTTKEQIASIGAVDVLIGILAAPPVPEMETAIAHVREALAALATPVRAVVVYAGPEGSPVFDSGDTPTGALRVFPYPSFLRQPSVNSVLHVSGAYRSLFALAGSLGVRACGMVASDLQTVSAQWVYQLIQPVLELDYDLVTPCYVHHKFEGLLNSGIFAPLTRSLYGKQLQSPMGPDLAFSSKLLPKLLSTPVRGRNLVAEKPLPLIAIDALTSNLQVCQTHVGARFRAIGDAPDVSSLLAQVLGPLFQEIEHSATFWQRVRGSQPVPTFGESERAEVETATVDVRHMIESFQLGARNLQEIWRIVLPPATLFELGKLARQTPEQFQLPDAVWVRTVYDFALGYRLRAISRDHLLRAMTPLYLAWVASYALQVENAGPAEVERRLETLAVAFEADKPYLLSRWRWPDRFNP